MNAVIIFDVDNSDFQNEIRRRMMENGYYDSWTSAVNNVRTIFHLPKNTLWQPNKELSQAQADLENIINSINAQGQGRVGRLLRCMVFSSTPWAGIVGEP